MTSGLVQHWSRITALTALTALSLNDESHILPSLTQLQYLDKLRSLSTYRYSGLTMQEMFWTTLEDLSLYNGHERVCNLEACVRLTSLALDVDSLAFQQLILPRGDSVQLQSLSLNCSQVGPVLRIQISNLHWAQQLTQLWFEGMYPRDGECWPQSLPKLRELTVYSVPESPPADRLVHYPSLTNLFWSGLQERLPACFSQLTQLTVLAVVCANFSSIPFEILALSQLSVLGLDDSASELVITQEVIEQLLTWPNLKYIGIKPSEQFQHSGLDAHLGLNQLLLSFRRVRPNCEVRVGI